jgi:hypothetical protein
MVMEEDKHTESFSAFRKKILKTNSHKKGRVNRSIGVYDIYKMLRKEGWKDIGKPVSEHNFYSIIRKVNRLLAEDVSLGKSISFPCRMGCLELRKSRRGAYFVDGKLHITYPIDWDKTLRLWYMDKEAEKAKTLVRREVTEVFHVRYCKAKAIYNNKSFYEFSLNSFIRKRLKENVDKGFIDALYDEF